MGVSDFSRTVNYGVHIPARDPSLTVVLTERHQLQKSTPCLYTNNFSTIDIANPQVILKRTLYLSNLSTLQPSTPCAAGPDRVASSAPGRRELCEDLREDGCTELYQSSAKALPKALPKSLPKPLQELYSRSEWSTQCARGSARSSARGSTQSSA